MNVAIADDQPILIKGLSMIIDAQPDMTVIWTASTGREALLKVNIKKPDVILMDIRMPDLNGIEATKEILALHPEINIVILTTFLEEATVYEALKNGAKGFLLKDAEPENIVDSLRSACNGGTVIAPQAASYVVRHLKPADTEAKQHILKTLTPKELDVARGIARGLSNKEIAQQLFMSEGTVKNHLSNILEKLELRDRTQLAILCVKNDL